MIILAAVAVVALVCGYVCGLLRERHRWEERARATRIGIARSLGRDTAERGDGVGTAVITSASYRRTRRID